MYLSFGLLRALEETKRPGRVLFAHRVARKLHGLVAYLRGFVERSSVLYQLFYGMDVRLLWMVGFYHGLV